MSMIYELLYIIPSKFSDTEIDGIIENVAQALEKRGAKIEQSQNLGKIKFAYPIKKVRHGTYVLCYIETEPSSISQIESDLRLMDEVLRHMIVKCEDGIPSAKYQFKLESYQAPLSPEGKRTKRQEPEEKKVVEKNGQDDEEDELSTSDLDKKLDEILEKDLNV